jgi:xanthine dehydrogenase YagT iron-sulfur-binding subunit
MAMQETDPQQLSEDERRLLDELLSEDLDEIPGFGEQRRNFLKQIATASSAVLVSGMFGADELLAAPAPADLPPVSLENAVKVSFKVNGAQKSFTLDSRMTLLDSLREKLGLTGSKKGCDHGQCGACTVIVDGKRVLSCLTLAASCQGKSVTTIEGIAKNGTLHPVQTAFIKHDGFQCGFCTPGQICSAVALMTEVKDGEASYVTPDVRRKSAAMLSDDEIRERMSGNLCRCGAYPNILAAIKEVHTGKEVAQGWSYAAEEFTSHQQSAD